MYKAITCALLTYSPQSSQCCMNKSEVMLYGTNYLCNVGPWLTDTYEENNLYNTVLNILGQHFIHCLVNSLNAQDNTPKKTVLYIYTINTGPKSTDMFSQESPLYCSFKSLVALFLTGYNIPEQSCFFFQCWLSSSFMTCGTIINRDQH